MLLGFVWHRRRIAAVSLTRKDGENASKLKRDFLNPDVMQHKPDVGSNGAAKEPEFLIASDVVAVYHSNQDGTVDPESGSPHLQVSAVPTLQAFSDTRDTVMNEIDASMVA